MKGRKSKSKMKLFVLLERIEIESQLQELKNVFPESCSIDTPRDTACRNDSLGEDDLNNFLFTPIYEFKEIPCTVTVLKNEPDFPSELKVESTDNETPISDKKLSKLEKGILIIDLEKENFNGVSALKPVMNDVETQTDNEVPKMHQYCCQICKAEFINWELFKHHELMNHSGLNLSCYCNVTFTSMEKYQRHIFQHLNEKLLECVDCQAVFTNIAALKKHICLHEKNNWKKYDLRSAGFDHHDLKIHERTTKLFSCSRCKKLSFKSLYHLRRHLVIHKRSAGKFSCQFCETKFLNKSSLRSHEGNAH